MSRARKGARVVVRPRWIWIGLLAAVVGMVVAGLGVTWLSWPWSLAGALVLLSGIALALAGGVMYDAHVAPPSQELHQVLEGGVQDGLSWHETSATPTSRRRARQLEHRLDALEAATRQAPRPYPVRPAAVALIVVAVFLLVAQWELYPTETPGQTNANRALGCAIVIAVCGLRVAVGQPHRPRRSWAAVAAVAGLLLLLNGLLSPHERFATALAECVCGGIVLLSAAVVFAYRPAQTEGSQ